MQCRKTEPVFAFPVSYKEFHLRQQHKLFIHDYSPLLVLRLEGLQQIVSKWKHLPQLHSPHGLLSHLTAYLSDSLPPWWVHKRNGDPVSLGASAEAHRPRSELTVWEVE